MSGRGRPRAGGTTAIDGAIGLIAVLLVVQMWLLTATLEAFLAGHHGVAAPAAAISAVLFSGCAGLYLFLERLDRVAKGSRR
jgi:hypothetical protein